MKAMVKDFGPAFFWGLLILFLSTRGRIVLPEKLPTLLEWDKLGHALFYCIMATTIYWGLQRQDRLNRQNVLLTLTGCTVYGVLLEYIQFFYFPGRYFEVLDIVANIIGTILSLLVIRYFF